MAKKRELKKKYGEEKVFIVPIDSIAHIEDKFSKEKHNTNIWGKFDSIGKYVYRYDAEGQAAMQQVIPYIVICNEDEGKYYVGKRLGGEQRLVDKLSLGFGGHINECDGYAQNILKALTRELEEELDFGPSSFLTSAQFCGYMRDITSTTNDHVGLVFILKAKEGTIRIKETDNIEGMWMTKQELFDNYSKFEGWACYLIDYLFEQDKKENKTSL